MSLTFTDLFCGAGGSSLGARHAGAEPILGVNHWDKACDDWGTANPQAEIVCADVSQLDPRRFRSADLLLASPECTHHSQARSNKHRDDLFNPDGDPRAERSRATMWDVPRFAEAMRDRGRPYRAIVVENVMEIMRWLPIDAWFMAMRSLGYRGRIVSLNAMVAWPTPQSRDRWFACFSLEGDPAPDLELRPPSWCTKCEKVVEGRQSWKRPDRQWGKYGQQYVYRCSCNAEALPLVHPAVTALDLSLACPRIGDRAKPLAPATRRRIEIGLRLYGPALVQMAGHTYERGGYARAWPIADRPMPTQMGTLLHGLVVPVHHGGERGPRARATDEPLPTQTGRAEQALVVPMRTNGTARPADGWPLATITTSHAGGQTLVVPLRRNGRAQPADTTVLPTVAAGGQHHALVVRNHGGEADAGSMAKPSWEPLGTLTSKAHQSVVALPFTVDYHGNGRARSVAQPLPTQDTRDRHALVDPAFEVDDCGFRMLEPPEVGRGQGFPDDYSVTGTKRDRVRKYGNAVPPPAMSVLVDRIVESLG